MLTLIKPATLQFSPEGVPYSSTYDDIYHSRDGGQAQSQHVFLNGNQLPQRWQQQETFTILETGFGLGINFLTTCLVWLNDPLHCRTLHYISVELHPFKQQDLQHLLAHYPQFTEITQQLLQHWPLPLPGVHRLDLFDGQIKLTLFFGDAAQQLASINAQVNAFYLDGFAPHKNPDLWSEKIFRQLKRLAAPEASLATWTVANHIREGLSQHFFSVRKEPGFASKRQMLCAQFTPPSYYHYPIRTKTNSPSHAIIIGAGLAGCATAHRLAERGWQITLFDRESHCAQGASGNPIGIMSPLPSLDDNAVSELTRSGSLYTLQLLKKLSAHPSSIFWQQCGALHLAENQQHAQKQQDIVQHLQFSPQFLQYFNPQQASAKAGYPVKHGGWWLPLGTWIAPPIFCETCLSAYPEQIQWQKNQTIQHIQYDQQQWHVFNEDQQALASAPYLILANNTGVRQFNETQHLPIRSARGQISILADMQDSQPECIINGSAYLTPCVGDIRCLGATFTVDDPYPLARSQDNQQNLDKLNALLPNFLPSQQQAENYSARVGFRPITHDRMPIVGPVALPIHELNSRISLDNFPRKAGLFVITGFGARGLTWGPLLAELLASQITGEALPLPQHLVHAVDPARFLFKTLRHQHPNIRYYPLQK